jgi:catechol 2,3-dioxygenase-like lactoylglutathione lyase family enzyme/quinol monooxygenase YgiN
LVSILALVAAMLLPTWLFAQEATGSEVSAISELHVIPGHEASVWQAVQQVREATLKDPGCAYFFATVRRDDPSTTLLFEQFRSEAAFRKHVHAEPTVQFLASLQGKVQGDRPVVTLLRQSTGPVSASTADAHSAPPSKERVMDSSLPRGIDHIGLTVPDVNAASTFLEKAFGARVVYDVLPEGATPMAGTETEKELGIPHGTKIVHMRLVQIGTGPTLELFHIEGAPQQRPAQLNDFGLTHVAVYVDDIHAAAQRFQEAGGTLLSPPHGLAGIESGAQNAGVYGRAPWGGLIELLTYASGIQYPDPSNKRWTPPAHP